VQYHGKLPQEYTKKTFSLIVNATHFISTIKSFKVRKTKKLKCKGVIKVCIYLPLFPFEFIFFTFCFFYSRRGNI